MLVRLRIGELDREFGQQRPGVGERDAGFEAGGRGRSIDRTDAHAPALAGDEGKRLSPPL